MLLTRDWFGAIIIIWLFSSILTWRCPVDDRSCPDQFDEAMARTRRSSKNSATAVDLADVPLEAFFGGVPEGELADLSQKNVEPTSGRRASRALTQQGSFVGSICL